MTTWFRRTFMTRRRLTCFERLIHIIYFSLQFCEVCVYHHHLTLNVENHDLDTVRVSETFSWFLRYLKTWEMWTITRKIIKWYQIFLKKCGLNLIWKLLINKCTNNSLLVRIYKVLFYISSMLVCFHYDSDGCSPYIFANSCPSDSQNKW